MKHALFRLAGGFCVALACLSVFDAGCATAAPAQRYKNPVIHADYSDPDVIRAGDDYFLVASSFHFSPGLPVLQSKDLVHWRIAGHVLDSLPFHPSYDMVPPYTLADGISKPVGSGMRYAGGVWAPAIRQHGGRFYVYWATPDEGIFMSSAQHPAGPWSAPVTVLAGAGYEDPCPFWDDDGKAWLVHSKVGAGPIILHAMSLDGTRLLDAGKTIIEDKVNLPVLEGPKVYKRNGWYYIFAPIGGVGTGPQAVLRARSIHGPYEHRTVLNPGNGLNGPHQGGYVETPSGEGWFVHFNSTGAFGRIAHLQPVVWENDWPVMGDGGLPVPEHAVPRTAVRSPDYRLQDSDEFSDGTLGLQWSWNHNPDAARWSLAQRPGFLRIEGNRARHLVGARNTLTQILQGPAAEITTRIELQGMAEAQRAGLTLFGVKVPWIGIVREGGANYLAYANAGQETRGPRIDGNSVVLRASVRTDQTVQFSYALGDNDGFRDLGPVTELAKFSWWKGSRPAVFTYIRSDADEGKADRPPDTIQRNYIDVDWFRVRILE
ncbi:family 43 glycosylhydrolase [Massilia dura]|uniref:Family 43 glycosylhydrolase n=1 Tax=Pseudoduganella dura TaxID=321982 RepID=A0A6I3XLR7_9BURK|nr:glycoside hydrolase 43 family protein [Pseudoduganella dura]MUI16446.1 family 43 glycosylhydrolase [Pseudoduganella dura]GGX86850.1 beta-xylosidase [Pseudoduganella dura]